MKKLLSIFALFFSLGAFAQEQHLAELIPASGGKFALMQDKFLKGGFRVVATIASRDSIEMLRRSYQMWVKVTADGKIYELDATNLANTGWAVVTFGVSQVKIDSAIASNMANNTLDEVAIRGNSTSKTIQSTNRIHAGDSTTYRKLVGIGSSWVVGAGFGGVYQDSLAWINKVAASNGFITLNMGRSGRRMQQTTVGDSSIYDQRLTLPVAPSDNSIVIIDPTPNDISLDSTIYKKDLFGVQLASVVDVLILKGYAPANIILFIPYYQSNITGGIKQGNTPYRHAMYAAKMDSISTAKGVRFLDFYQAMHDDIYNNGHADMNADSLHATVLGHAFVANRLAGYLSTWYPVYNYNNKKSKIYGTQEIAGNLTVSHITSTTDANLKNVYVNGILNLQNSNANLNIAALLGGDSGKSGVTNGLNKSFNLATFYYNDIASPFPVLWYSSNAAGNLLNYGATGVAGGYAMTGHRFYTAPVGTKTAGGANLALNILPSGNVQIGNASTNDAGYKLQVAGGKFQVSGGTIIRVANQSLPNWGTSGSALSLTASTFTDTTSTAGVAHGATYSFGMPTIAATNPNITYANASTVYIQNAPAAGTNVSVSNPWALYIAAGTSFLGTTARIGSATKQPGYALSIAGGGVYANGGGFNRQGSFSAAAWGLNGSMFQSASGTVTDSTSVASTQIANAMLNSYAANTINTTNSVAGITTAATVYIAGAPVAGANVTGGITNPIALQVASGQTYLAGNAGIGTLAGASRLNIAAGNATLAPLHLNSGALLATPVAGTIEYLSPDLAFTNSGTTRNYFMFGTAKPTAGQLPVSNGTNFTPATLSGDATLGSTGALTLTASGVTAGAYGLVTVDAKGRVTAGTTINDVAHGGTGLVTGIVGDVPYFSAATTIAKLTDVATGNVLRSGGVGAAPAYGKVNVTTDISGVVPAANLGTGAAGGTTILYGDGTYKTAPVSNPGTVTNVTAMGTQGVTVSVATGVTTPVITIGMDNIMPTTITASGNISASNFSGASSGTNTGDQANVTGNAGSATLWGGLEADFSTAGGALLNVAGYDGSKVKMYTPAQIKSAIGAGTVTSVTGGYGLVPNTVQNTSVTLAIDTASSTGLVNKTNLRSFTYTKNQEDIKFAQLASNNNYINSTNTFSNSLLKLTDTENSYSTLIRTGYVIFTNSTDTTIVAPGAITLDNIYFRQPSNGYQASLNHFNLTGNRSWLFQNKTYTIAGTNDNVSEFINDVGYITSSAANSNYIQSNNSTPQAGGFYVTALSKSDNGFDSRNSYHYGRGVSFNLYAADQAITDPAFRMYATPNLGYSVRFKNSSSSGTGLNDNTTDLIFSNKASSQYTFTGAGTVALTVQPADLEVTSLTSGLILKSPNGTRWRLTVSDTGTSVWTAL